MKIASREAATIATSPRTLRYAIRKETYRSCIHMPDSPGARPALGTRGGGQAVGSGGLPWHPAAAALSGLVGGCTLLAPAPVGATGRGAPRLAKAPAQHFAIRHLGCRAVESKGSHRKIIPTLPRPLAIRPPPARLHPVYPLRRIGLVCAATLWLWVGDQRPELGAAFVVQCRLPDVIHYRYMA